MLETLKKLITLPSEASRQADVAAAFVTALRVNGFRPLNWPLSNRHAPPVASAGDSQLRMEDGSMVPGSVPAGDLVSLMRIRSCKTPVSAPPQCAKPAP